MAERSNETAAITYRRDGSRYQVYVGDARTGVLVGFVERTDSIAASNAASEREWVATDLNGSWVSTDSTRRAASVALARVIPPEGGTDG